jgi:hypothetical protein
MKFTVHPKVHRDKVLRVIPPRLVNTLPATVLTENEYAVILFGLDGCITSNWVNKALEQVRGLGRPIVVTGSRFTLDAIELLQAENAIVAVEGESYWTDAIQHRP